MSSRLVVALFGPTASAKTEIACRVADRLPMHLISCDAVQVYRDLRAATAKPRGDETRHRWALVDWVEADGELNLGDWVRAAEGEIEKAWARERIPMIVGGTGLYLRGLLKGVTEAPPRDVSLRERLGALAARHDAGFLHRVLRRLDPDSAARILSGDLQRIVRALEVRLLTGVPLSSLRGEGWAGKDRYDVLRVGLELPRERLYERINQRVKLFLADGLVDEVRWLLTERGLSREAHALRAIGYREVCEWLGAQEEGRECFDLEERIQRNTRRYARRQMTWFSREENTHVLDALDSASVPQIVDLIRSRLVAQG